MENIINIVNFIRGAEPRHRSLDLVEPVREQIRLMKECDLPGTFLIQYDAMLREDMVSLLRELPADQFEIGIWFEMNQPHVEAAGLAWRGREGFEWDWHAHCGFSVGYTKEEREKLIDVIFAKFEETFGFCAKSVGSWMIDAHSLRYMSEKYGIEASCNCKDQWGTDGYTIWGGYWNQGYYPSKYNVLCPAQSRDAQIDVPVFRMLGSDPVTQYDLGLSVDGGGADWQQVATLEPVYDPSCGNKAGGCPEWVDWFMRQNFCGGSLAFAYAQAGQENSFGWKRMKGGLEYQFPLFAAWRKEKGLRVEKLCDTGRWYRQTFAQTPATAVCAEEPFGERMAQSVWYNCKNYRINLYRDAQGVRVRDLVLFDEAYEERYMNAVCTTDYLVYDNLSLIDGNRMSGNGILAGGYVRDAAGNAVDADLKAEERGSGLHVSFGEYAFDITEEGIALTGGAGIELKWVDEKSHLREMGENRLFFEHNGARYALNVQAGGIREETSVFLMPEGNMLNIVPERM